MARLCLLCEPKPKREKFPLTFLPSFTSTFFPVLVYCNKNELWKGPDFRWLKSLSPYTCPTDPPWLPCPTTLFQNQCFSSIIRSILGDGDCRMCVYFLLPETKQAPIEEIYLLFEKHWFWKGVVGQGSCGGTDGHV